MKQYERKHKSNLFICFFLHCFHIWSLVSVLSICVCVWYDSHIENSLRILLLHFVPSFFSIAAMMLSNGHLRFSPAHSFAHHVFVEQYFLLRFVSSSRFLFWCSAIVFFFILSLSLLVNTHNIQFSEMGFLSPLDSISVIRSSDITIANVVQRYTWYVLSNRTSPATFICVFELQLYLKANVLVIVLLSNP